MNKIAVVSVLLVALVGFIAAELCISCNSASDANCVVSPWLIPPKSCNTRCYSRVLSDGNTLRGCTDDIDERVLANCTAESNCLLCNSLGDSSNSCNNEVFPAHRLACHQCVGALNSNCSAQITTSAQPCPVFNNEDSCYIRKTSNTVERGCVSSSSNRCSNLSHCFICNGHGCNHLNSTDGQIPLAPSSASLLQPILPIFIGILVAFHFTKY